MDLTGRTYDKNLVAEAIGLCHVIRDEMPEIFPDFDYLFIDSVEYQAENQGCISIRQLDSLRNICEKFRIEI